MIVLREEIIAGVVKRFKESPLDIRSDCIYSDLMHYVEHDPLGKKLIYRFNGKKLPGSRTVDRALNEREGKLAGVRPELRDLLCYYAFGMSWEEKMIDLLKEDYNYETEKAESVKLRGIENGPTLHKVINELSGLREQQDTVLNQVGSIISHSSGEFFDIKDILDRTLTNIDNLHQASLIKNDNFVGSLIETVQEFSHAQEKDDPQKMIDLARGLGESIREKKNILETFNLGVYYTLIHYLHSKGLHEEIISVAPSILQIIPDDFMIYAQYGISLFLKSRFEEAIIYIRKARDLFPEESKCIDFECRCYCMMRDHKKALELLREKHILRKTGALYSITVELSKIPFVLEKKYEDENGTDYALGMLILFTALTDSSFNNGSDEDQTHLLASIQVYSQCETEPMFDDIRNTLRDAAVYLDSEENKKKSPK